MYFRKFQFGFPFECSVELRDYVGNPAIRLADEFRDICTKGKNGKNSYMSDLLYRRILDEYSYLGLKLPIQC